MVGTIIRGQAIPGSGSIIIRLASSRNYHDRKKKIIKKWANETESAARSAAVAAYTAPGADFFYHPAATSYIKDEPATAAAASAASALRAAEYSAYGHHSAYASGWPEALGVHPYAAAHLNSAAAAGSAAAAAAAAQQAPGQGGGKRKRKS